jgi:hypothetical protein
MSLSWVAIFPSIERRSKRRGAVNKALAGGGIFPPSACNTKNREMSEHIPFPHDPDPVPAPAPDGIWKEQTDELAVVALTGRQSAVKSRENYLNGHS